MQEVKSGSEKDFYKLLNNSFETWAKTVEIAQTIMLGRTFAIRCNNLFDSEILPFLNSDLLREKIDARLCRKKRQNTVV